MQFLSAASAWFAVSLPAIAVMYMLKKSYQDTEISSHLLWRRVLREQEANRPWQKLRGRWLLLLQLLAALALVLALMEPVLTRPAAMTGHAVLLIDRSVSMTARPAPAFGGQGQEGSDETAAIRLQLAVDAVLQWMDRQPGNRPVTLVTTGTEPEVLVMRETNRDRLKERLREIKPFYGQSDHTAALSLADSLHQGDEDGLTLLFTDGNWKDAPEANELLLQSPLELIEIDREEPRDNAAILYFGVEADPDGNGKHTGIITVSNDSNRERQLAVDVYAADGLGKQELAAELVIAAAPGEWQSAEVKELPDAEYYKARIRDYADGMLADNTAYQFPQIQRDKRALLVTRGNLFLEKALLLAGVKTVKMSPDSAAPSGEQAEAVDWILLDGAEDRLFSDSGWSELLDRKPAWIIDHPDEKDAESQVPDHTRSVVKDHPVTVYITLKDTHIGRIARPPASELGWAEPILTYGNIPAIYAGTADGKPMLRFAFNLQDTDLPLKPEFPVLVIQAAEWMGGEAQSQLGTAVAGSVLNLSLQAETTTAHWQAIELSGAGLPEEQKLRGQAIALESGEASMYTAPLIPGLYRLEERNAANEVIGQRMLAVAADFAPPMYGKSESETLSLGASQADGELRKDHASPTDADREEAHLYTYPSLQIWAIVFLLLLMTVEWEVYRRGHSS